MEYKIPLKQFVKATEGYPGAFAAKRLYDIHTGIDLYTTEGAEVFAIEDGLVVKVDFFTGPSAGLPWWNDTWAVMIEGESGVINYGEIKPSCAVGDEIKAGDLIGVVIPVLSKNKIRDDIPGHSNSMLHLELYEQSCREFAIWQHGEPIPKGLLDPNSILR